MAPRPKHQDKDIEALLRDLERQGWTAAKGKGYFKTRCPCGQHAQTIHLTPSGRNYRRGIKGVLRRQTCWEEER